MTLDSRAVLKAMSRALEGAPRRSMFGSGDWAADVPATPGVYALWDISSSAMVYVGETASLLHRMQDIGRSVNHTCRRKLAKRHRLANATEDVLSKEIGLRYVMSFIAVPIGRLELEEYLSLRHAKTLINSPGKRLLRGNSYDWVERL